MTKQPDDVDRSQPRATNAIDSRCPACQRWVTEGESHRCPRGRHRDVFKNPAMEE